MPRQLGDITPLGAIAPFGSDCEKDPRLPELSRQLAEECAKTGESAGKLPKSACADIKSVSDALNILATIGNAVGQGANMVAQSQFQDAIRDGQGKMVEGQNELLENGATLNDSMADWLSQSSNFNTLNTQLSNIGSVISSTQSQISSLSSSLSSLNAQLASSQQAVADANARLASAQNSANYPRTPAGLSRQRADLQSANTAVRDASLSQASIQNQISSTTTAYNSAVASNNSAVAEAQSLSAQAEATRAGAEQARAVAERAQQGVIRGQEKYGDGVRTIQQGAREYQNVQRNVVVPAIESANGMRGVSGVLDSVSRERFYEAGGKGFSEGYASASRLSGNAGMMNATGIVSGAINSFANALESGAEGPELASQAMQNFGQATLRTGDMANIADNLGLADCIFSNTSNPNRVYDGFSVLSDQIAPGIGVASGIAQTLAPFVPPLGAVSPAIPFLENFLGTGAQGLARTAIESVNTAWKQGGLSSRIGDYVDRGIGRGLVDRPYGNAPSAGTVGIAGLAETLTEATKSLLNPIFGKGGSNASQASATINQIANTGRIPPLRAGDISIRPPQATPVYAGD